MKTMIYCTSQQECTSQEILILSGLDLCSYRTVRWLCCNLDATANALHYTKHMVSFKYFVGYTLMHY